jgi:hypothetical protein
MTVRCNKRVGVVSEIRTRVSFKVTTEKGVVVGWYVDGEEDRGRGAMRDLQETERDNWTRRAPMSKEEKLELIREMKDWLKASKQEEHSR